MADPPTMTVVREAVARYADRFHAAVPDEHHVASPLGAWMLLALLAPVADPDVRRRLEEVLGTDAVTARAGADALLAVPHDAVVSALALWTVRDLDRPALDRWGADLPPRLTRGPLPDQAGLDAWAREKTLDLIETFPLDVGPQTVVVLASVLATRVPWAVPLEVVGAERLRGPWSSRVERALLAARSHRTAVVDHPLGRLGLHVASSEKDTLQVASVVAGPDVARADVLRAAHEIAVRSAVAPRGSRLPGYVDPFDLPLGEGPAWTVTESAAEVTAPDGRERAVSAVLPAWSAGLSFDLLPDEGLGFADAAATLGRLVRPLPGAGTEARQVARVRYTATGFEAAALTAMAVLTAMPVSRPGVRREVEIRFGHPYAVVAVARDRRGTSPWHGVPVFSAWVAEPAEAEVPESS